MATRRTCYRCGQPATSVDHVPPKAFFPKEREARGLRKDLVTVPSCDDHNGARSSDDQYLASLFVVCVQGDHLPQPFVDRMIRGLARGERPLGKRMLSQSELVLTPRGPTAAVSLERERLEEVLISTAYGLLYALDGKRTPEELEVFEESGPFGSRKNGELKQYDASEAFAPVLEKLHVRGEPQRGANPEVFSYMATRDPVPIVRMVFYQEIVVWVTKVVTPRRDGEIGR